MNASLDCTDRYMETFHCFFRVPCPPSFIDLSTVIAIIDGQNLSECDVSAIESSCGLQRPQIDAVMTSPLSCDFTCLLVIVLVCCALFGTIVIMLTLYIRWRRNRNDDEKKVINDGKPVEL